MPGTHRKYGNQHSKFSSYKVIVYHVEKLMLVKHTTKITTYPTSLYKVSFPKKAIFHKIS